jgi:hypothetical protein
MVMAAILEDFKMAAIIPWEMKNHSIQAMCMHSILARHTKTHSCMLAKLQFEQQRLIAANTVARMKILSYLSP